MLRPRNLALLALVVLAFLFVSAILARAFSIDGAERSALTDLVSAEARGDAAAMLARMTGCSGGCRAAVERNARDLRRPGRVYILLINPSAGFSLGSTSGVARVAWKTPASLPIVQCIRVRRAGNVLSGLHVELLAVGRRIRSDGVCPSH